MSANLSPQSSGDWSIHWEDADICALEYDLKRCDGNSLRSRSLSIISLVARGSRQEAATALKSLLDDAPPIFPETPIWDVAEVATPLFYTCEFDLLGDLLCRWTNLRGKCFVGVDTTSCGTSHFFGIEFLIYGEDSVGFRFDKSVLRTRKFNPVFRLQSVKMLIEIARAIDFRTGRTQFQWSDDAKNKGLGFSSKNPDVTLVPDRDFTGTNGYAWFKSKLPSLPPWEVRKHAALWRGTLWLISPGGWRSQLRTRLCQISNCSEATGIVDAGFTDCDSNIRSEVTTAGLMRESVDQIALSNWRYVIDIDGYSNSWSGLFTKLCSGSTVLKVHSDYRQWYYDRLVPWVNYVPIAGDLSDLLVIKYLLNKDEVAKEIGRKGQELAMSMSLEGEIRQVSRSVLRALAPL